MATEALPVDAPDAKSTSVLRDRSFNGMLITQFLGVFNDNVFKQLVLFVCVDLAREDRTQNLQGVATVVFAVPFILLSGLCGFLADRFNKRTIVVLSKTLEIVVMLLGMIAFWFDSVNGLLLVLFFMGAQSALFGPAKYGILPELFPERDLPTVNGVMMMTMFIAIILGFTTAGALSTGLGDHLWIASIACVGIAVVGTLSATIIRRTPTAHPDSKFHPSVMVISPATRQLLFNNRRLAGVVVVTSLFWMTGGVVYPPATNDLGTLQFGLTDAATGRMAACTGLGIAIGCITGGLMCRHRFNANVVRVGGWGMLATLLLLAAPGPYHETLAGVWGSSLLLVLLGACAGLFTVPLNCYVQAKAPKEQKGRIIGVTNLVNWIGIALSGIYYHIWNLILAEWEIRHNVMFAAAAILLLPIVLFYQPASEDLAEKDLAATPS